MNRDKKTEYLLSSIGEIDDILLAEAENYRAKKKKHFLIPLIAACLAFAIMATTALSLSIVIPVGIMLFGDLAEKNDAEAYPENGGELNQSPSQNEIQDGNNSADRNQSDKENEAVKESLESLLERFSDSGDCAKVESFSELSYVGEPSLVWQSGDEGEIFVKPLSSAQLESVERYMGSGDQVGQRSPKQSVKVWILDGEGNVNTPYLKNGAGNTDVVIFDYEAEIVPSEDLVDCISDILN